MSDVPETTGRPTFAWLAQQAARQHGDTEAARWRSPEGDWRRLTYPDAERGTERIARGLLAAGVRPGDRVAVQGGLDGTWMTVFLAVIACGAACVPVLPTTVPAEIEHVVGDSGAVVVFCADERQLAMLGAVRARLPRVRSVVLLAGDPPDDSVLSLAELCGRGEKVDPAALRARQHAVSPDDLLAILYTSGTTGAKKGCKLSHRNYLATVSALADSEVAVGRGSTFVYMTPHSYAVLMQLLMWTTGCPLVYVHGRDLDAVLDEIPQVAPVYLPTMPLLLERLYARALTGLAPPDRQALLVAADEAADVRVALDRGDRVDASVLDRFASADRELFPPVRALFGDRVRRVITGAAPVAPGLVRFFQGCGVPVLDSYGLTEAATTVTMNWPSDWRPGSVGRALPGVELAVAADGEVLVRGESVFAGYWGHTDGAFGQVVDGWLHTGDLGELDGDGHLRLVGRKKELIELSNGWMVSPAGVEALLNSRVPISTAVAFGEGRPHLVALLALDPVWLARTAGEHSLDGDPTAAAERVRAALHAEVAEVNAQVPEHQRIRAFAVLPRPLSPEHGELTGTLKLCRPVVYARHRDLFDALYAGESVSDRAGG